MSENIGQRRQKFSRENFGLFCPIFSDMRMFIFGLAFVLYVLRLSVSNGFYKMAQYNTLNVKLSNSQLTKLKSGLKNETEVTLKLSSNVVGDFNGEKNFAQKLLLTNTQVSKLRKAFANNYLAKIKLSKTHLHEIG